MSDPSKSCKVGKTGQSVPKPTIIIAAKNRISRRRMARALAGQAGRVEMTGSAVRLMSSLLHKECSVIVLADGLAEGLALPALVPLLKRCNPQAAIILAADDVPRREEFTVRQQGIFYCANRPVGATAWDELQLAVDCACNRVLLEDRPVRCH
jgi:hypothetical protein